MALARDAQVAPMFTSAHAYWHAEVAKTERSHLERILAGLRQVKDPDAATTVRDRRKRAEKEKEDAEKIRRRLVGALPRAEGEVRLPHQFLHFLKIP